MLEQKAEGLVDSGRLHGVVVIEDEDDAAIDSDNVVDERRQHDVHG